MEESNLNLNNTWDLKDLSIEEWTEEVISDSQSQNIVEVSDEITLSITDDDIEEPVKKPKFSFLWLFGKKETDKDLVQEDSNFGDIIVNNNNNNDEGKDNIIVWPEDNTKKNNVNIFQELGDLNFLDSQDEINFKQKADPLIVVSQLTTYLFYVLIFINIVFFLHIYIKSTDSEFVSYLPWACYYIWTNIDWYNNDTCKTFPQIVQNIKSNKNNLEKSIVNNLKILIPSRIQIDYILATPEVKFILDKKSSSNVLFTKIINEFELIRQNSWGFEWKNIKCTGYSFNEKWILNVTCDFLWSWIDWTTWYSSSRTVAIDLLNKLQTKNSNFQVLNYPKTIDISRFNSSEWIEVLFQTKTTLSLNLKYNLSSK